MTITMAFSPSGAESSLAYSIATTAKDLCFLIKTKLTRSTTVMWKRNSPEKVSVFAGASRERSVLRSKITSRYPVWLEALALASFLTVGGGLVAAWHEPTAITELFVPFGLFGVWLTSRISRKF